MGLALSSAQGADTSTNEIYVENQGHTPGSIAPPSITVYPRSASGNRARFRTIRGVATRLDDVRAIFVDTKRREIVAASGSPLQLIALTRKTHTGAVEVGEDDDH